MNTLIWCSIIFSLIKINEKNICGTILPQNTWPKIQNGDSDLII